MPPHTHYDNLKVSRTAPIEVIRASYKALAQKYHPDLNPNNSDAARVMTVLNLSYGVLSDPAKRAAHDAWIAEQEAAAAPSPPPSPPPPRSPSPPPTPAPPPRARQSAAPPAPAPAPVPAPQHAAIRLIQHVFNYWIIYLGLGVWIWYANTDHPIKATTTTSSATPSGIQTAKPAPKPAYVRPDRAPNGEPWPASNSYVGGYGDFARGGLSSLTVDNTQNDSDVFVKLVALDQGAPVPVRHFFIYRGSQFRAENIRAGNYDIRYRDMNSGQLSRSDPFELTETRTFDGTTFSNMTMTLYKVHNGNMQTHGLAESDF
ncbi:MAG TPA: J domain-containing protein [Casimicrobium sp.]|nr:J domain-containing protein [Casimicrobium sp.]